MKNKYNIIKYSSKINKMFQTYLNEELKEYEINYTEFNYILNLDLGVSVNQRYISQVVMVDDAAVTRIINKLAKKEYIIRKRDEFDKRNILIELSEKGADLKLVLEEKLDIWMDVFTRGMSSDDINQIESLYELMISNLEALHEK